MSTTDLNALRRHTGGRRQESSRPHRIRGCRLDQVHRASRSHRRGQCIVVPDICRGRMGGPSMASNALCDGVELGLGTANQRDVCPLLGEPLSDALIDTRGRRQSRGRLYSETADRER